MPGFLLQLRLHRIVLASLIVAQWGAVGLFAAVVRSNGWLFYQGGDETYFYTTSWVVSGGHIPKASIGYGWSYLLAPVAGAVGPSFLAALPVIVVLQVVFLLPVALYCVYAIVARIGGRSLGYFAAALWIGAPFLAIPLWEDRYHPKYVEQFLPGALGLTGLGDFPSTVCLLVAALFCVRALDTSASVDAALAGAAAGFAIAIKPANALFLAGPLLGFAVARRPRIGLAFAGALLPPLVALALWKYRGLGQLPIVAVPSSGLAATGLGFLGVEWSRYLDLDWSQFRKNYVDLRELFWGFPIWQLLPLLGFLAAARRSWPKALVLGGWLAAFVAVKGSSPRASVDDGTLLRLLMPSLPSLLILVALVPLLLPGSRSRASEATSSGAGVRVLAAVEAVIAVIPLLLFAALPVLNSRAAVTYAAENVMLPVDRGFRLELRRDGGAVLVSWRPPPSAGVRVFYRVFRSRPVAPAPDPVLRPGRDGIRCLDGRVGGYARASDCWLEMPVVGTTSSTRFVDRPPPGQWVYRIGLAGNWRNDSAAGVVTLVSAPALLATP